MIAIVDYGVGNLFSLRSSLQFLGIESAVTGDAAVIADAERIILPGVGAFGDAMDRLRQSGLEQPVKAAAGKGVPLLGICLGMQLLFESSSEFGRHAGLGLLPGQIEPLLPDIEALGLKLKVPHMGWNPLVYRQEKCPLFRYLPEGSAMYYVHSYYAKNCGDVVAGASEYGVQVPGAVWQGNVFGTQFHPEKSGDKGLLILKAFAEVAPC